MYRWYWFRKLQLGETDIEEPRPAPARAAAENVPTAAPSRAAAGGRQVLGESAEGAVAA